MEDSSSLSVKGGLKLMICLEGVLMIRLLSMSTIIIVNTLKSSAAYVAPKDNLRDKYSILSTTKAN